MYKIGICEDEMPICFMLEKLVKEYGVTHATDFDVQCFMGGEELKSKLDRQEHFDLIFMDIELGGMSGIEVAQYLRNRLKDEFTQIIFVSANKSYALDLFAVRPLDFIIKPVTKERLTTVMDKVLELSEIHGKIFTYKIGRQIFRYPVKKILYFRCRGREVDMFTKDGKVSFYGSIGEIGEELRKANFFFCHKSYLVNYYQIESFGSKELTISNGDVLCISQGKRKNLKEMQIHMEA